MNDEQERDASVGVHRPDVSPPRSSRLAAVSLVVSAVGGALVVLHLTDSGGDVMELLWPISVPLLVGGGVGGVVAGVRIRRANGDLRGASKAVAATVIGCVAPLLSAAAVGIFVFYACS